MIRKRFVSGVPGLWVVALCLALMAVPGWTWADEIGSAENPDKVGVKQLPAEELGVTDCPASLNEAAPARIVMQIINNTFYKWKEYDLGSVNGKSQFCIVVEEPYQMKLLQKDAEVLLKASQQWLKEASGSDEGLMLDASDPILSLPPREKFLSDESKLSAVVAPGPDTATGLAAGGPFQLAGKTVTGPSLQTVIGTDDRVRVTATTTYPWNSACYLGITVPGVGNFRGAGCLVTPWMVLTAGHMVYDQDTNQWVSAMTIAPGQRQDTAGGVVTQPYGTRSASWLGSNTGYTGGGGFEYDYGAAFFNTPFSGLTTFVPLQFDVVPGSINTTGYPREVKGETNSLAQWWSYGPVTYVSSRLLRYTADTSGGNSGGRVWIYNSSTGLRRQVAVHAFGSTTSNGGPRLVSANLAVIQGWMNWRPVTPPAAPTNVQATDGTYNDKVVVTWTGSSGATGYRIYRNTVNNSSTALYRGQVTASPFSDFMVEPGLTHYYWVKAINASGASGFSLYNTGYRRMLYTLLPIAGSQFTGNITPLYDADWYYFNVVTPGIYVIQTWAGTLHDNIMYLYGPNTAYSLIAWNDDGGPGLMANLTRSLSAGRYYIKVKPYWSSGTGTYYIRIEGAPSVPPLLALNQTVNGLLNFAGDTDTYRFVVTTPGTYTIDTNAGTLTDSFMFLYGPNSQTLFITSNDDYGIDPMARITRTLSAGTYYVRIIAYYGTASGSFTIRLTSP